MHRLSAQVRWTGSFNKIIAFLDRRKQGRVFCSPVQEGGKGWWGAVFVSISALWSLSWRCTMVPSSPKASHITEPCTCGRFRWEDGETELIFVVWALFLDWNRFHFWSHISDCSCVRKGWTSPFLWRPNKIKGCLCYSYILIAQPFCS